MIRLTVLNSTKSSTIDSETYTNNNAITDKVIDTNLLTLKAKGVNGDIISCTIYGIPISNKTKTAKQDWQVLLGTSPHDS